ncbi:MAG: NAD(P)/FAD-dependent oxidoreductase [Gemmatimonadetes bacterium]|nr:NAD(P)/FAD-dependent oxidoreductase [Gemmatimonadota bacterium]
MASARFDAVVVGSGPNGLSAAVTLARDGYDVRVVEGAEEIGGGACSAELTIPGFVHDLCSAVHPLGVGSPFLRSLPLADHGLEWIHPHAPLAHPLDQGGAVLLERSVDATASGLGADAAAWRELVGPFVDRWDALARDLLGPPRFPRRPVTALRFALRALRSSRSLTRARFRGERARALFSGIAAHSMLPLDVVPSAAVGTILGIAGHAVGWPVPKGGAGTITGALAAYFRSLGGTIETGRWIRSLGDLPPARAILLDVTPRQLLSIAGPRLPALYRSRLARWRYGPGVFKVDWALEGPIPWRDPACARAGTVHLGGREAEIEAAEAAVARGEHPKRPFVLLAQPSLFDPTRAPAGKHVAWAYTHVPVGSELDVGDRIAAQIERFAPGFADLVLARRSAGPAELERRNPNCVGGSIGGGSQDLAQTIARPLPRPDPYRVPGTRLYLCSSSTPPGPGVHGLCGWYAARSAIRGSLRGV